jgi:hypothetical protein
MTPSKKSPEIEAALENFTLGVFGRSRTIAIAGGSCVSCGKPANEFKDAISRREFGISGLCQKCQDSVFG